ALAAQDKQQEARQALERAISLSQDCQNKTVELFVRRKAAVLQMNNNSTTKPEAVQHELADALAVARGLGMAIEEFEIRLAQYKLLNDKKNDKEVQNQFVELANEASRRGLKLIS